jgi:hypothetical protein
MEAQTLCQQQLNNNINNNMMKDGDIHQQLLRRVFQMCDVQRRGHISIDDLLELGQSYLGQDTKVNSNFKQHFDVCWLKIQGGSCFLNFFLIILFLL